MYAGEGDIESCWNIAMEGGRVQNGRVIIEEFITFQSEITLLTVRSVNGTSFCAPIGHIQEAGIISNPGTAQHVR